MFGLEKRKGKEPKAVFELEKELKQPAYFRKMKAHVEKQVQNLKQELRSGGSGKEFEDKGVLLHGYAALLKLMNGIQKKNKRNP